MGQEAQGTKRGYRRTPYSFISGKISSKLPGMMSRKPAEEDVPDPATGLTPREKRAITDSWALLKKRDTIITHGIELLNTMFREYPYMMAKFSFKSFKPEDLHKDPVMRRHALSVMYSVGNLVKNLDDAEHLVLLVNKIAQNHLARNMNSKYFQDVTALFPGYLVARAGSAATPFVQQSWTKLLKVLTSLVHNMEQEQREKN